MPQQDDKTKILYDAVSQKYDIGSFDDFSKKLQDPSKRKAFYDGVGQEFQLGAYDEFENKIGVKKKEPSAPGGNVSAPAGQSPSESTSKQQSSLGPQFGNEMFQTIGQQPVTEDVSVKETVSPMRIPTPRILSQKRKSFLENDIDVSLNFSLNNPALNKTKDKISLSAPRKEDGSPSLDMPFEEKVAMQKRQITTDPVLLKEYGRSRMQQIGQMASEFSSAADASTDPVIGITVDNETSAALRNKATELQSYQKEFRESLKHQAALAVTGKAIALGQSPDPIQIGREILDVISDPTLKEDEKVLADLKNPSSTIFTDAEGVSHEMQETYNPKAADKSQQNINYNLYRTGADAMRAYYDQAREDAFKKSPDKIQSLTTLLDAWGKLTPQEQKNAFNPVNAQIQSLRTDPDVNNFISANIDYSKAAETSANAIKQFPQVERMNKISRLNEAWFDLSNAKSSGGYGSELSRIWRLAMGDKPSDEDIPSLSRATGFTKEEIKEIINQGGTGLFHWLSPTIRTSGFLPGVATGAHDMIDNVAMGVRRYFDPSSSATETKNRIQRERMQDRDIIAQGNMLKDDMGKWNINPLSVAHVFGYGMGQTAIMAAPALASGGFAAEGSILSKGLELVNTVVPGAAASYEDAWKTAKANGADDSTAKAYAFWVSLANGGAEAIYSPAEVVKGISGGTSKKLLFSTFMRDVENKGLNKTISSQIKEVGSKIWNTTKEPANVLLAENVEEFATDAGVNALDEHYLGIKKTQAQLADQTFTTFVQTTFQTLPLAIGVGIGGTRDMSGVRKQALFEVGQQPDLYKSLTKDLLGQQKITQAEYNTKLSHINQLQGIVSTLPKQNAHGKQLTYDESAELTAQQFRVDVNEQKLKNGTITGEKPIIEADTKEAVKRQEEILNPELSEKVMYQGSEWTVKKDNGDTVDIVKDDGLSFITINKSELGNLKTKEDEKVVFPVRNNDFAEKYFSKESPAGEESEFAKYQRLKDENEDAAAEMITNKKEDIIAAAELPKGSESTSDTKSEEQAPSTLKSEGLNTNEGFQEAGNKSKTEQNPEHIGNWMIDNAQTGDRIKIDDDSYYEVTRRTTKKGHTEIELQHFVKNENGEFENNPSAIKIFSDKYRGTDQEKLGYRGAGDIFQYGFTDVDGNRQIQQSEYIPKNETTQDTKQAEQNLVPDEKVEIQQSAETEGSPVEESNQGEQLSEEIKTETINEGGQNDSQNQTGLPGEERVGQEPVQTESESRSSEEASGPSGDVQVDEEEVDTDYIAREDAVRKHVADNSMDLTEDEIDLAAGLIGEEDSVQEAVDFVMQDRVNNSVQPLYNYIKEIKSESIRNKEKKKLIEEHYDDIVAQLHEKDVADIKDKTDDEIKAYLTDGGLDKAVADGNLNLSKIKKEEAPPPRKPPVGNIGEGMFDGRDKDDAVINKVLRRRVDASNYKTLFKENIVRQQDTAITQGEKQEREVNGDYVVALEKDLRGVSVQNAADLKATLGDNWDLKTLDYIERSLAAEEQPGNPAQVVGILNIISTKNYQEIHDTRNASKLGELYLTQMRIDKAALEVSRDASLALNMRRLYATFAKGGNMADELAQEMVLTKTQQKFRDHLSELLITQPTEQEINEAPRPKKSKAPAKEKTAEPKKENSKATKEQIILEGAKTAENKSFRDYIRDAKEKLKNIKC